MQFLRPGRRASVALLTILLLSCGASLREEALQLASSGEATATRMATLYDDLAKRTVETWELSAWRNAFEAQQQLARLKNGRHDGAQSPSPAEIVDASTPAPDSPKFKAYQAQYAALRSRARLARKMAGVYGALSSFASWGAGEKLVASVDDLESALGDVADKPLKVGDRSVGTTGALLDGLVKAVATWKQNRDLKAGAKAIGQTVAGLLELFRSERELYRDIDEDYRKVSTTVARELVRSKSVISTPLVEEVLAGYQLSWPDPQAPFADPETTVAVEAVIEARANTVAARAQDEEEGVGDALADLLQKHEKLAGQPLLSPADLKKN